jgi:amino acid adenylation domain-containing protein
VIRRLQDWLARQADGRPEAAAIVFRGESTTYGELEESSNRLARTLKNRGCVRGDRVALFLPKSPRALIAMFAALKADCIYVPVDTASPANRLERILRNCDSRCIVAEESGASKLLKIDRSIPQNVIRIDSEWPEVDSMPDSPVDSHNSSNDAAHILFTSGSTGMPKGVAITHANAIAFVTWAVQYFGISSSDRISGHPPLHFDLSTFDIYGTVASGAQIHLLTPEASLLPHRLADFIRDARLTQWFSVPSILRHMATLDAVRQNDFPSLKRLLWCGERFPTPALMHWMRRLPHVNFFNLYGPTEATVASSFHYVARCPENDTAEIPIGKACNGEKLLVLDDTLNSSPIGEIGDLYIAGVGLSPGYWNDPVKTAEVFIWRNGERIYKTGDLAKVGDDGLLYLVGRSDMQIKSRGYRIEIGEIEAAIHALSAVRDAAVVAIPSDGFDSVAICCAFVPAPDCDVSPMTVRQRLRDTLPPYMIPTRWMVLDRMPANGNGKVNRPLLKERFRNGSQAGVAAGME